MKEITFELETITPLFIAGADQRNIENEGLRAPSLRGLLRWWFRAIMGGMTSVSTMRNLENEIFGSTQRASLVKLKVVPKDVRRIKFVGEDKRCNMKYFRRGYDCESKFDVHIYSREKPEFNLALGSLWTAIILGGIGGRSRRGAGSLRITDVKLAGTLDEPLPTFTIEGGDAKEVRDNISKGLEKVYDLFIGYCKSKNCFNPPKQKPNFCILSKETASIHILQHPQGPYRDYKDGLRYVFERSKNFRHNSLLGGASPRKASPFVVGVLRTDAGYFIKIVEFYTSVLENEDPNKLKQIFEKLNKSIGKTEIVTIPEVK